MQPTTNASQKDIYHRHDQWIFSLTALFAASTAAAAADFGVDEAKDVGHQFSEVCQTKQHDRYADERIRNTNQPTPERLRRNVTVTCSEQRQKHYNIVQTLKQEAHLSLGWRTVLVVSDLQSRPSLQGQWFSYYLKTNMRLSVDD